MIADLAEQIGQRVEYAVLLREIGVERFCPRFARGTGRRHDNCRLGHLDLPLSSPVLGEVCRSSIGEPQSQRRSRLAGSRRIRASGRPAPGTREMAPRRFDAMRAWHGASVRCVLRALISGLVRTSAVNRPRDSDSAGKHVSASDSIDNRTLRKSETGGSVPAVAGVRKPTAIARGVGRRESA